ncbi:NAD(P)-binding protein [Melanomma pulvis-pyrius CBS 109.77]|uniref:NAD(P)-binding protein n=1 Tax=Melanomma pulvis-pyrius CBS 109.77 TaxID=1314802 RepID=A0A6A6X9Z0_9PLEO|nr:NAD(P)-binding protein [Melanomma pulvis-pyrius CBS 109.77]
MATSTKNVIVFGPTGGIGRVAAIEANKRGAKVWLAMRDTSKTIQGLEEGKEGFSRVQADLSQPASLKNAIQQSGATAAFVYTIHNSEDNMKASFEALKAAGITYIVVISSYSVKGPAGDEKNAEDFIPRLHAKTEIALEQTGVAFTAVRPAYFTSNILWNKAGFQKGEIEIVYPSVEFDFIAPEDIGTVAGALLVKGEATKPINLCGPKLYSQKEAYEVAGKTLGIDLKVIEIDEETFFEKTFLPRPIAESIVKGLRESSITYPKEIYEEAVQNIRTYGGIEPTTFTDWVESHKAAFT